MILSNEGIKDVRAWEEKGYHLPRYDRQAMIEKTKAAPRWVHFGAGNIFRALHCAGAQKLLDEKAMEEGIIVVEGFDYEIIEKLYRPHDDLSIFVSLKSDGTTEKSVVGSIAESCILDSGNEAEFSRLKEIFSAPSLQLATFTITEKGYVVKDAAGELLPGTKRDIDNGPEKPESYIGKVTALLYERYQKGASPLAMVSTDNCSHNGDKLKDAVLVFAQGWADAGKAEKGFADYLKSEKVSFPWTMIDKITPRPDPGVEESLKKDGVEGLANVVTSKKTWCAPFVNAEESEYLVMEDDFPAGRPPLEQAGFILTDRETVDKVERMKVCTCLNPLHTALAVFGCLLGFTRISEEMRDAELKRLVERIGYEEGLPVVTDPGVISPKEFIDTVVGVRLPNPFMPDAPQRIATDTSQKLSIRFGETIKNYRAQGLDLKALKLIPLVFAGWLRYLMGVDDQGERIELSPDPRLNELGKLLSAFSLGDGTAPEPVLESLLRDASIFGVDLYEAGLAGRVLDDFTRLKEGKGAVRKVLREAVQE